MATLSPITVWGHNSGPNPWKVVMIFEELGIPYELKLIDMAAVKAKPYTDLNPNGRVPAIEDPNTGIKLWESGAIIEYLIDTYDKENKLNLTTFPEKYHLKQWLHFQMSGQGPYYGQAVWFTKYHGEDLPSARKRYHDQLLRVLMVLNNALEGKEYLVGDKCTYADIAFVSWDSLIPWIFGEDLAALDIEKTYPNYFAWNARLTARPAIQKTFELKKAANAGGH